jgi:two-component system sensor histidine kinase RstB
VLTILFLVALSTISSFWLVGHVNEKQQKQNILGGILLLAAKQVQQEQGSVQGVSKLLGVPLKIGPLDDFKLGRIEEERLRQGGFLQRQSAQNALSILVKVVINDDELILSGDFQYFRTSHIRGTLAMIQNMLQRDPGAIALLSNRAFLPKSIPLRILSKQELEELDLVSSEMIAPNHVARRKIDGGEGRFYSWLPEIQQFIELGPIVFNQNLTLQSILVVIVLGAILSGIAVYWLVHRFELSLQHLERASSRIASGHLNSRVKVASPDAFGRLGEAFNRMAEQIQRLMGVQKEMIRAVSHELRTPIARMRFGVQMLEDSATDNFLVKQVQDMDQDLQELDELVDEILTYARLEEGGPILEFKSANMLDLVDQVVEETRRRTDKVDIQWHSRTTQIEHIFSDIEYRYMHRAIQNLVGNACRYAKGNVFVEFSFDNDICRVDVEDDGEGIPEKDWDRVFSPFTRLDDSRTRASGGYGLGLSIVRRIIYWHGGTSLVGRSRWNGAKMSLLWPKSHHGY